MMRAHSLSLGALALLLWGPAGFARADAPPPAAHVEVTDTGEIDWDPLFDEGYEEGAMLGAPDPLEETNRRVFEANRQLDRFFFDPVTRGYRFAIPEPARKGLRNLISNLNSPTTLVNDLLQLEWEDASITVFRLVVNSTVGVGGLFDVANRIGLEKHRSDFGQTLALAGVPSGAFVMVPLFGPTSVRDGFGTILDIGMSPTTHIFGPLAFAYYGGGMGLALRDEHYDEVKALEESSLDYYSTLRSAWWQNREAELWGRRQNRRLDADYGP